MADFDSSLPVRTQAPGDIIAKIADATTPSQQLKVNADGSINVTDNGTPLAVDLSAASLAALESITVQNTAGAGAVNIQDGGNSITVDGTFWQATQPVSATDLDIRDLSHTQDSVKIGDGTDLLAVNPDGSINVVISNDVAGTEVCDYQTSASLAANASVNFDYTVTAATTLIIDQVWATGSGKIKVEVKRETAPASGTYSTKFVAFNSTASANCDIDINRYLKQVAGAKIRITITNRDNQSQDVYSTLTGSEA